jgi:hypothetical protein
VSSFPSLLLREFATQNLPQECFFHLRWTVWRRAEEGLFVAGFFDFSFQLFNSGLNFVSHAAG